MGMGAAMDARVSWSRQAGKARDQQLSHVCADRSLKKKTKGWGKYIKGANGPGKKLRWWSAGSLNKKLENTGMVATAFKIWVGSRFNTFFSLARLMDRVPRASCHALYPFHSLDLTFSLFLEQQI